jgi:chromosome partitioning protein
LNPPVESNRWVRCIAVINQKGGVGKTTSTVNIGAALAGRGNKVLLLDIDPQANLTLHLDCRPEGDGATMTDLLVDGKNLAEMISETGTEGLYMIPADTSLAGVETMLANRIGRETILREAIEAFEEGDAAPKFDYIFLDCPPSLGVLSANALVSADEIIIPMQAEYFSMQGMTKLMEVMQLVKQRLNPDLSICLILPCMVDRRTNLTNEVLGELRQHFGDVLAETCIRSNVKLAEAPSFGRTIFEHAPESNGARDYDVVADELLRRFAGTFEVAPLESELEEDEEDAIDESEEEGSEVVEPVAADEVTESEGEAATEEPAAIVESPLEAPVAADEVTESEGEAATEEPAAIVESPLEAPVAAAVDAGAPFVESVPPAEPIPAGPTPTEPVIQAPTTLADDAKPDQAELPATVEESSPVVEPEVVAESAPAESVTATSDASSENAPQSEPEAAAITNGSLPEAATPPPPTDAEPVEKTVTNAPPEPQDSPEPGPVSGQNLETDPAPVVETAADAGDVGGDADRKIETSAPELQEGSGA